MSERKIARLDGLAFFFFWLLVLLAGVDRPLPWRYLRLIPAFAILEPIR
jgi:hypothetical protein